MGTSRNGDHGPPRSQFDASGLAAALDAANLTLWEWDPDAGLTKWQGGLLGVGTSDAGLGAALDRVHLEDRDRLVGELTRSARDGGDVDVEFRARDAEGRDRWVLARGRRHRAGHGGWRVVGVAG